jgi:prevent-host-death family protein
MDESIYGIILRLEDGVDIKNDIKPISYIKTHAADMLKRVNETQNPMIITQNGEAKAVLLDTESYQQMTRSIGILKILATGEKEIEKKKLVANETVFEEIQKRLLNNE